MTQPFKPANWQEFDDVIQRELVLIEVATLPLSLIAFLRDTQTPCMPEPDAQRWN
jgi:hypothetical protein